MVGGPNSSKHPIDYEFSEFDRTDLIYQFAKKLSTEENENLQKTLPEAKA
jgi:hypothetical protein